MANPETGASASKRPRRRGCLRFLVRVVLILVIVLLVRHFWPVYVDIALDNWLLPRAEFHAYLEALVRAGFGKRIMYGSDHAIWPDNIDIAIAAIETADFLSEEQKDDIFYNNAARFLRLDAVGAE